MFKKKEEIVFPSVQILLSVIQKEYEYERERLRDLQSRTGIFLTLASGLFALIPNYAKLDKLKSASIKSLLEAVPYIIYILILISTFSLLVISIFYFVFVLRSDKYKKLDYADFSKENATKDIESVSVVLMETIKDVVQFNKGINDEKIKKYEKGILMTLLAVVTLVLGAIISFTL